MKKKATSNGRPALRLIKEPQRATKRVFQLKMTLHDVKPSIWRQVQIHDCTLATLHTVIQISMGWCDGHLHVFEIDGDQFGDPEQWEDDPEVQDSQRLKLGQLVSDRIMRFRYIYDMGDGWDHTIKIEKTLEAESGVEYPRCIAGERACPPEDCGGPWGYADLVEALKNPKHDRHAELKEWLKWPFDPEALSLEDVNDALVGLIED